ncbi:hypothetical protein F2Q69_00034873 [Brassica cretica]|uniref:Uncharacterized protein n=1 Tax=Brassica cretica TaxID=69181 RepID=A0A8S9STY8_BRACR|nr:hypothetical protein F2Q69_00034873 [Brassica cretica]
MRLSDKDEVSLDKPQRLCDRSELLEYLARIYLSSRGSDHDDSIDTVVTPPVDAVAEQGHTVAVGPEPVIAAENTAGKVIEAAVTEPVAVAEPAETGPP